MSAHARLSTRRADRAEPPEAARANHRFAEAPPVRQLKALGTLLNAPAAGAVVQRVVLHRVSRTGKVTYYSHFEDGAVEHDTREEAEKIDDELSKKPEYIAHGLNSLKPKARKKYKIKKDREKSRIKTLEASPDEVTPRRSPVPYAYMTKDTPSSARIDENKQGPHSLSFSSLEHRLQKRLTKNQHDQLPEQIPSVEQAMEKMRTEYPGDDEDTKNRLKRYELDYTSHLDKFNELYKGSERGVGSYFHLVTRRLMQLNPYTTYGKSKSGGSRGENRYDALNSRSIDPKASTTFKSGKNYEIYLQTRGDMYHSSDEESEHSKPRSGTPYEFSLIPKRERKYKRKAKKEGSSIDTVVPESTIDHPISIEDDKDVVRHGKLEDSSSEDERIESKPPKRKKEPPKKREFVPEGSDTESKKIKLLTPPREDEHSATPPKTTSQDNTEMRDSDEE